jgi:hypothetical protein
MGGAGSSVEDVVSHHEGLGVSFRDCLLERHQVILPEVPLVHDGIAARAPDLVVIGDEMLEGRGHLDVLGVVALQSLDDANRQGAGKEGVLAVGLLVAAPARLPSHVHHGRPEGQADALSVGLHVVDPPFISDRVAHLPEELGIPGGSQADVLRKLRGRDAPSARPAQAVQALGEVGEGLDAQPLDGGSTLAQEADLLLKRQQRDEVVHPLFERQFGVAKGLRREQRYAQTECHQQQYRKRFR